MGTTQKIQLVYHYLKNYMQGWEKAKICTKTLIQICPIGRSKTILAKQKS